MSMKVVHCEQVEYAAVETEGASGCRIRCLMGEADGAPSFTMRQFEVAVGGHTPKHAHGYEHEVFVLQGNGVVSDGDRETALRPGTAVLVPPGALHQFRNTGSTPLVFLCLIPHPIRGMAAIPCAAACGCDG
jgi:quercetin dioxygenase-like cupin family protein